MTVGNVEQLKKKGWKGFTTGSSADCPPGF